MKYIAHRGNVDGPLPDYENHPQYIREAIHQGYYVEVDVWSISGIYYLGHDEPLYGVDGEFLRDHRILCHAKNVFALERMLRDESIHCFWHSSDDYTISSQGLVIAYPGKVLPALADRSILMMPEMVESTQNMKDKLTTILNSTHRCYAVCSDYIGFCKAVKEKRRYATDRIFGEGLGGDSVGVSLDSWYQQSDGSEG